VLTFRKKVLGAEKAQKDAETNVADLTRKVADSKRQASVAEKATKDAETKASDAI